MEMNEKPIINRIKVVLAEQRRTNKWLAKALGKDYARYLSGVQIQLNWG